MILHLSKFHVSPSNPTFTDVLFEIKRKGMMRVFSLMTIPLFPPPSKACKPLQKHATITPHHFEKRKRLLPFLRFFVCDPFFLCLEKGAQNNTN